MVRRAATSSAPEGAGSGEPAAAAEGLLARGLLRAKLEVGAADDPLEREAEAAAEQVISEHGKGLDLFIDLDVLDDHAAERTKQRLRELLEALERRPKPA